MKVINYAKELVYDEMPVNCDNLKHTNLYKAIVKAQGLQRSPHIVNLVEVYTDVIKETVTIVYEYCDCKCFKAIWCVYRRKSKVNLEHSTKALS